MLCSVALLLHVHRRVVALCFVILLPVTFDGEVVEVALLAFTELMPVEFVEFKLACVEFGFVEFAISSSQMHSFSAEALLMLNSNEVFCSGSREGAADAFDVSLIPMEEATKGRPSTSLLTFCTYVCVCGSSCAHSCVRSI